MIYCVIASLSEAIPPQIDCFVVRPRRTPRNDRISLMKLLLGTTNQAKIADYKKYLVHSNLELVTLKDIGFLDEPLEIGETFEEIALQKARFYAERTEYPTLADDGGLEVDALGGEPGVNSRRWVGLHGTDEDRIEKVFRELEGIPEKERTGRFRIVNVVYFPHERDCISVESKTEVLIPNRPSAIRIPNFPYRSVMFLPQFSKYYSELSQDQLIQVDHRLKACQELLLKLEPWLNT